MIEDYKKDYECYFVEHIGNMNTALKNIKYAFVYEEFPICSMIIVEKGRLNDLLREVDNIISIEENNIFTLSMLGERYYNLGDKCTRLSSYYTGRGVRVGLIGIGVDYLDKSLLDDVGKSRVISIWDQSIEDGNYEKYGNGICYGKEFNEKDIEKDTKVATYNGDKYRVTSCFNDKSFGTNMCKIIGGNPRCSVKAGMAKNCEYAVVNLRNAKESIVSMNVIEGDNEEVYATYDIITALRYLAEVKKKSNKPMVVYLPIETNSGGRSGESILNKFINYYSQIKDFIIVTTSGCEGDGYTHNEGVLKAGGDIKTVEIMVDCDEREGKITNKLIDNKKVEIYEDEEEYNFKTSIWINNNDEIGIRVISPSGETTKKICKGHIAGEVREYKLKDGIIEVQFLPPKINSNIKEVLIKFRRISRGLWNIDIIGEYVLYGNYNIYLPIKSLTNYKVRFKVPSIKRTLNSIATGERIISTSCYCQNEKDVRAISGKGFSQDDRISPTISVDSTGIIVLDSMGDMVKLSGIAVSGAILSAAIALLLEWAVVEKNHCHMSFEDVKLYIIKSTINYEGNVPIEKWGYGLFDINKFNELLRKNRSLEY